ncbi:MAG: MBL fold metallo-hydrolase [Dehalococcoidales bacterium]|nr:MBL fold metallo-hydrolase [Dehalococcoidales bacterium]
MVVPNIVQVAEGIYSIGPIDTDRYSGNTSPFLVVGDRAAIVETGEDSQAAALLEAIKEIGVSFDRIDYLIPSHIHTHHSSGINVLLGKLPNSKAVAHQRAVQHLIDPTRLNEDTVRIWGEGRCSTMKPVPADRIIGVSGGEVFDLGGRELEIIATPGHAPHHLCVFDRLTRAMITGDLCEFVPSSKRGVTSINPPVFDAEKTVEALRLVQSYKPKILLKWRGGIAHYMVDELLRTAVEDTMAIERICLEGMRQKLTADEIDRRVEQYKAKVGVTPGSEEDPEGTGSGPAGARSGLSGLYRYLTRKYPDLEMPQGAVREGAPERGPAADWRPGN